MECAVCGRKGEYDAVYHTELVKICKICSEKEGIPVIKKPSSEQLQAMERQYTVGERLARLTGVKPKSAPRVIQEVKRNLVEKARPEQVQRLHLIDNFHWHITRARRARGLTLKQLALSINEPEHILLRVEQGSLPSSLQIFDKLEQFLKIKLKESPEKPRMVKVSGNKENLLGKEIEIEDEPSSL